MLGRNGNIAYVRYDHQGRIVPGGPIISAKPPRVGNWQAVSNVLGTNTVGPSGSSVLRAFIRVDYFNRVVPSSLVLLTKEPGDNNSQTTWIEINAQYRGKQVSVYSFIINTILDVTNCEACSNYEGGFGLYNTVYSNVSTLVEGSTLYYDSNLTVPFGGNVGFFYGIDNNGIVSAVSITPVGIISAAPYSCSNCPTSTTTTTTII